MRYRISDPRHRFLVLAVASVALFAAAGEAVAQAAPSGESLYRQRCGSCHAMQPGVNRVGPSLQGVVGRRAAAVAGFNYSPALRDWGQSWTPENLERYLAGTREAVPGTRMVIPPPAPAQRRAIIQYLQSQP